MVILQSKSLFLRSAIMASVLFAMAGCASQDERNAAIEQHDIKRCIKLGFTPETDPFAECIQRLEKAREKQMNDFRMQQQTMPQQQQLEAMKPRIRRMR